MLKSIVNYILIKFKSFVERMDESPDLELDNSELDNSEKGKIIKKKDDWFISISRENEEQGIKYINMKRIDMYNK